MLVTVCGSGTLLTTLAGPMGAGSPSDSLESVFEGGRGGRPAVYVGLRSNRLRASTARLWATIADQT